MSDTNGQKLDSKVIADTLKAVVNARTKLVFDHPFFAVLAMKLRTVVTESVPTAATDGENLYVNPNYFGNLTPDEQLFVIAHEAWHCAQNHVSRGYGRDPMVWNYAIDYITNKAIVEARIGKGVEGMLHDPNIGDRYSEDLYEELIRKQPKGGQPGNPGDNMGADPGGCGAVISPGSVEKAQTLGGQWDQNLQEAANAHRMSNAGRLPVDIERMIESRMKTRINWRSLLRHLVNETVRSNYSFFPPSRRWLHQDLVMPDLRSKVMPPIQFLVDVSGSMSDNDFSKAIESVSEVLAEFGTMVQVLQVDTRVKCVDEYEPAELPIKAMRQAYGGTNLFPGFEWIAENVDKVTCVVAWSDLEFYEPLKDLGLPTIWVTPSQRYDAPFGQVVRYEDD